MPTAYLYDLTDTWNSGVTDFDGIRMSVTDTASGPNSNLFQLRGGAAGATSFFRVKKNGGTVITQGALTAADRVLDLSTTWNNAGVTFTGFLLNVTETAAAAGSLLAELQVNGVSQFSVRRDGAVSTPNSFRVTSNSGFIGLGTSQDVQLFWDAANVLAQRRTTNPQTFRVYHTFTDASNNERGTFGWSANVLRIGTENFGTGLTREWALIRGGTVILESTSTSVRTIGSISFVSNNNVFANSAAYLGWTSRALMQSPADGIIALSNSAVSDFNRLQFGGTGAGFPALKRVGVALHLRTADDGDFSDFSCRTQTITQGIIAAAVSALDITANWSNTGQQFTAIRVNITNTGSLTTSNLIDLQVGGGSQFSVTRLGNVTASGNLQMSGFVRAGLAAAIGWSDASIVRDGAANTVALSGGTAAQSFRVYNTVSGANFERGTFDWQTTLNTLRIGTENGGTGLARGMDLVTGGTTRISIASNGLISIADGLGLLGGVSTYFGIVGRVYIDSPASGVWRMTDSSQTTFGRLCLGPATNAFPAWKRSGAVVQARLGDDSGFTDVECDQVRTNNGTFLISGTALTNGAGANTATMTNAPAAGNPTKWIPIDDNGTTRYIPVW